MAKSGAGRPGGSKNKRLTTEVLEGMLRTAYEEQGLELEFNASPAGDKVNNLNAKGYWGPRETPKAATPVFEHKEVLGVFEFDESEGEDGDEPDTYSCGKCDAELDSKVSACPNCGADLTWGE